MWGTRPEAIKLCEVVRHLKEKYTSGLVEVYCTGQHTDLLDGLWRSPAEHLLTGSTFLGLASRRTEPLSFWVAKAARALEEQIGNTSEVGVLVVQGDTMSAWAGALAGRELKVPVAHVEAGLRSHDLTQPYPEEMIRMEIARIASIHFAPTPLACANLMQERAQGRIFVTGNPGISTLAQVVKLKPNTQYSFELNKEVLVTMHRREWIDRGGEFITECAQAFVTATRTHEMRFIWPVHPVLYPILKWRPDINPYDFVGPLTYHDTVIITKCAHGVITDSGGLQEECAALGVPCAVMRSVSDRPESIERGMAKLFSPTPDGFRAAVEWLTLYDGPREPLECYGGPESAETIADSLLEYVHA